MFCSKKHNYFKINIVTFKGNTDKEATSIISRTKVADSILNLSFLILHQRMKQFFLPRQAKTLVQENRAITTLFFAISLKNVEKLSAFVAKTN